MKIAIRVIGIVVFLTGILLNKYVGSDELDFISGVLVGIGIGLILTGTLFRKNKRN